METALGDRTVNDKKFGNWYLRTEIFEDSTFEDEIIEDRIFGNWKLKIKFLRTYFVKFCFD